MKWMLSMICGGGAIRTAFPSTSRAWLQPVVDSGESTRAATLTTNFTKISRLISVHEMGSGESKQLNSILYLQVKTGASFGEKN